MRLLIPESISWILDHTKTSWPWQRDANCSGMVMSHVHQVWQKSPCKAQWKGEEDKADRGRGVKTTSGNGQAWVRQVQEGSAEQEKKMEETGCEIICGAPTTLAVKGYMRWETRVYFIRLFHHVSGRQSMKLHAFRRFPLLSESHGRKMRCVCRVSALVAQMIKWYKHIY